MRISDFTSAVQNRAHGGPSRWLRRLAAPAAGLLVASLAMSLSPTTAHALSAGSLSVSPGSGKLVTLETSQLSTKTIVDLKVPSSLPFYGAVQLRSANVGAGYRTKVGIAASGAMTVSLSRVAGGVETSFGTPVSTGDHRQGRARPSACRGSSPASTPW